MSDRIRERYADACSRVQERINEIDAEIGESAALALSEVVRRNDVSSVFRGASRRLLGERILERLGLVELLNAHDIALEQALDEARELVAYHEREVKPKLEAEAKAAARQAEEEARDALIRGALARVKSTRNRVEKPDLADVELLRRHTAYSDRYVAVGDIAQLLWRHDHQPWWREKKSA